ncbi:hypothetical protein BD410DRAFT_786209 [Rickenella mellea]|uniref:Uncharacterized protein n=1 Tax=Rickenella mellea TaxID=50990 RepID=A0A4Y7QAK4_9AGAM|nr:hypothetical protein BD410DRAFT_786209 [Rickenella mellea]
MRLVKPAKIRAFLITQIRRFMFGFKRSKAELLPYELLSEIFLHCLPANGLPRPSICDAPILFVRVCTFWRSVALATPQLWAKISLSCSLPSPHTRVWRHEVGIQEWLRRSWSCPLSFEIAEHRYHRVLAPIITSTLQPEAHRWKAVRFHTDCACADRIVDMLCSPGATPMLTDLRFIRHKEFRRKARITSTPQLSTIHLCSMDTTVFGKRKLHALRELRINPGSSQAYSFMLTQCPSLEILEIICPSHGLFLPKDTLHSFRRLHTFIVDGQHWHVHGSHHTQSWLNSLDTPSLTSLAVTNFSGPCLPSSTTFLSSFLARCGSRLQRLRVSGEFLLYDNLVECLRHTPHLESLSVESFMLTEHLPALCPRLVHFDILVREFMPKERALLAIDTIVSRWVASKLKGRDVISPATIRVEFNNLSVVLKYPEIIQCINQGLRVQQLCPDTDNWWASQLPLLTHKGNGKMSK